MTFPKLFSTVLLAFSFALAPSIADDEPAETSEPKDGLESPLTVAVRPDEPTEIRYTVGISGTLMTPTQGDPQEWDLRSNAEFRFVQRQLESEDTGPAALRATRRYIAAQSKMRIGDDHQVETKLPVNANVIQVAGTDSGFSCASVKQPLNRIQLDLLQMPFDPLFVTGLLPGRDVAVGDKWNADHWVVPCLIGVEATVSQEVSCELIRMDDETAEIRFTGKVEGALLGSSRSVTFTGQLVFDREQRMLKSLNCQMTEKGTPGPVTAGIDGEVKIVWQQQRADDPGELPTEIDDDRFEQPLALHTPWRLALAHSRDWHIFNQTERVLMLRQIKEGMLVSQCNISAGVVVPPGDHTPDADFRADVEQVVQARDGKVMSEETIREDKFWRIRHVQATTTASDNIEIIQDHYLCSAASGEQFSIMFSHARSDDKAFGDEPTRFLDSLSVARRRPALPFR